MKTDNYKIKMNRKCLEYLEGKCSIDEVTQTFELYVNNEIEDELKQAKNKNMNREKET